MKREFYVEHRPALFPSDPEMKSPSFQSFIEKTGQRVDTGIGYGFVLWKSGEKWLQLHRSNVSDVHFLMAGIYGDLIFHLGASSRRPSFHADYASRISLRVAKHMSNVSILWRMSHFFEESYLKKNENAFREIITKLSTEPDNYIAMLTKEEGQKKSIGKLTRKISGV